KLDSIGVRRDAHGTLSTRRAPLARCLLNFDESPSYTAMPNFANDNDSTMAAVGKKRSVSVDSGGPSNVQKFFFALAEFPVLSGEFLAFRENTLEYSRRAGKTSSRFSSESPRGLVDDNPTSLLSVPKLFSVALNRSPSAFRARGCYVVVIVVGDAASVVSVTTPPREKTTTPHPSTGRATLRAIGERPGPLRAT
ncbi:hypothetical protein V1478_006666, partial [Vespula squamosa]